MSHISSPPALPYARFLNETSVSVGTTPTIIRASNSKRMSIIVENQGAIDLYLGGDESITTSTSIKVPANGDWATYTYIGAIYGLCSSGIITVRYMEESA